MLINKFKQLSSGEFIRNAGWMGIAELVNRLSRLATTVTLARMFTPQDYGLVSAIYTTFEFGNVLILRAGTESKIIQASEQELEAVCNTSYWLNWIFGGLMFVIQCIAAFPIAKFYGNNQIILPIITIALIYLMMPLFIVQSAMIRRDNRLKVTAFANACQAIIGNIITVILAILGMGVWAAVWAMVLSTPVHILINYRHHPWRAPTSLKLHNWQSVLSFSCKILGVELLEKVRSNLDYLLVGGFLGVEALGLYFFAFNAGLGISQNVIKLFTSSVFPYLCAVRENLTQLKNRYFSSLKTTAIIVLPLILLQASLAPLYVPIVFGQKWVVAIPILILICLSALPLALTNTTTELLNAVGKTKLNLYWNLIYTVIFSSCLLLAVNWGIVWVARAVLICQLLTPIFTIWAIRYVFK
ncbi:MULTISPECIES: lipopolysaccharide biosynthesis protein [Moorena]|uniref:Lipopolysaccharide biosynthesis protein n=2 Tax=Moorena producens TaxID=1155739 RepID=A0A1D9G1Z5_MOOP1|nr:MULTISPECIES: lipopolysaccharide biosynthesis protein [Moorena]AOY81440.1 lipopolysaccharide biosynthesis protein [Moorena producens JHB]EGJ31555.1 membrane protein involved in the export of O-antigen and teichoic acid [Moorena producens 3L]NEP67732.1 lipopolysaccharide biosynthesis protein [Moorena sp. SIO3A5]NES40478.1 lipopolysaccharide biosynthesis protein [Moorena sp. SIO2C4]OLT66127.1 lipopolysaccharide biosynthesis protein [Moorena producens 3L]